MTVYKKLIENVNILEYIFQFLTLEEQIECADLCESFNVAITKRIWSRMYKNLNIHKTPNFIIITAGQEIEINQRNGLQQMREIKTALPYDKGKIFLRQIAPYVHNLGEFSEFHNFCKNVGVAFRHEYMFENLYRLSCYKMVITDEQLQLIGQYCLQLQTLELIECTCAELESLIPGYNLDIRTLIVMPKLYNLLVESEETLNMPKMDCDVLHEMLMLLQLKSLVFKNIIVVDQGHDIVDLALADTVEILNVGHISKEYWANFKYHLKDFRNLQDLTINTLDCYTLVNNEVFKDLASCCGLLQKLSLENCDLSVDNFGAIKSLQHLSLISCGGFTSENLHQVLTHPTLKILSISHTRILGPMEKCSISPTLEAIYIDSIHSNTFSEIFQKSINSMDNVHTIKWLNGHISCDWIVEKCRNLRSLHIPNPHLIRQYILIMGCLQELSFSSSIHTDDAIIDDDIPEYATGVDTSLESIIIPYHIYIAAQSFWMDLIDINRHLHLTIYGDYVDLLNRSILKQILQYRHVRDNLRYLKICGFPIDLYQLKMEFDKTLLNIDCKINHFKLKNCKLTIEI
ncbi:uncharacterized protein LOC142233781 isoform X2 [Haematobia irritans]|uniref:uncharacterized protein LOC142233781 isoform X2 n=1 Tax=Haematobia irritans TaxID=7368 RepID=UPI003F4FBBE4